MSRILFVGQTGEMGGAEFVLRDLALHFGPGCHVALLADGPLRLLLEQDGIGVSVIAAPATLLGVARDAGAARALAAIPAAIGVARRLGRLARGFAVLYANSQKAALICMLAGKLARCPVIWHLHDILDAREFAGVQRRAVVGLGNRLTRAVVANSAASRDGFVACGGRRALTVVVPNGIDAAPFAVLPPASLRGAVCPPERCLVGMFGRLSPWKGQHVFLQALAAVPNAQGLIVGDALFGELAYRAELLAMVDRLGLTDRVTWLGFRHDVPALMQACDAIVHASTAPEPFGRVLVEAMLARRPVIATRGGASREVLGDDYPYLTPAGDAAALGQAIAAVLAAPEGQVRTLTDAGFTRATALFSMARMISLVERQIDAVAAPG